MELLIKSRKAATLIPARRFLVLQADGSLAVAGAGALAIGVSPTLDVPQGKMADAILIGIAEVEAGADLVEGQPVKPNANGRAVLAAPGDKASGRVWRGGPSGSFLEIHIFPHTA